MSARELGRLIAAYRWLIDERAEQVRRKARANVAHIDAEIDALFMRIVRFQSDDARILAAQLEFLIEALADCDGDAQARALLKEALMQHVGRLVGQISDAASRMPSAL